MILFTPPKGITSVHLLGNVVAPLKEFRSQTQSSNNKPFYRKIHKLVLSCITANNSHLNTDLKLNLMKDINTQRQ